VQKIIEAMHLTAQFPVFAGRAEALDNLRERGNESTATKQGGQV
jgi:hypothetical protein